MTKLRKCIDNATTGLDAIQRAPIVDYETGLHCLRIQDISQSKVFENWGYTSANIEDVRNFLIKNGDMFMARTGSTIGCNYYASKDMNSVFNNGLIRMRTNSQMLPQYLSFLMQTRSFRAFVNNVGMASATQPNIKINDLLDYEFELPELSVQQHIVNTIGSVDDLIENINKQNEKLLHIGLTLVNSLNDSLEHQKMSAICELIKGFEIGSQNYIETSVTESLIRYLRVGDLLSLGSTFVEPSNELMLCSDDDVIIAFDGAPGRNAIGLEGAYSSGIYKVKCNPKHKGLIYFEINSELNQKIIKDHSQGTTILHASKAIPFLETAKTDDQNNEKLNILFKQIINNKKKLKLLNNEKRLLLFKCF